MLIDRRAILVGGLALVCMPLAACAEATTATLARPGSPDIAGALAALEASSGSKFGVAVLDGKDGTIAGHRADERFTMCSTFKLSIAAQILTKIDAGEIARDAMLPITRDDPVGHAPAVRAALEKGETAMSVLALAQAAQVVSDNGAANILLRKVGGPAAVTAFWRSLGDRTSRLDRYEPELNTSHDGDPRDTTTAAAMARTLRVLLTGPALTPASRDLLIGWMVATQTGLKRLRGGLPADWRAGDKTGTMNGASYADKVNDIAIVWHPKRAEPFFLTGFLEAGRNGTDGARPEDEATLAQAARIAAEWIAARV
jgi:beta-lactamase class A